MPETALADEGASAPVNDEPIADAPFTPAALSSEVVYAGRIWDVRHDEFAYNGEPIARDYVDHTGAVGVLALDDAGRVLLINQYRHPVRAREWEIPAGLLDVTGESPLIAAQRELAEEVDLGAHRWDLLSDYATSPGGSSEAIRIFLARDLYAVEHDFAREGEEADMELRWVDLDEVVDAVLARRVQNSLLVIAALTAHAIRARGWAGLAPADAPWAARDPREASGA